MASPPPPASAPRAALLSLELPELTPTSGPWHLPLRLMLSSQKPVRLSPSPHPGACPDATRPERHSPAKAHSVATAPPAPPAPPHPLSVSSRRPPSAAGFVLLSAVCLLHFKASQEWGLVCGGLRHTPSTLQWALDKGVEGMRPHLPSAWHIVGPHLGSDQWKNCIIIFNDSISQFLRTAGLSSGSKRVISWP